MARDSVVPFGRKRLIIFHKMACSGYDIPFLIPFRHTVFFHGMFCFICNRLFILTF